MLENRLLIKDDRVLSSCYSRQVGIPYTLFNSDVRQIAEEHDDSFKQLLSAYSRLAKTLAFIDRLPCLVAASGYFKSVPADIVGDVLEFHSQTYTFLRRGGWPQLFQASWKNFTPQLDCILQRLDKYAALDQRLAVSQGKSYGATSMGDHTALHQGDSYVTNHITNIPSELLDSIQQQWIEARSLRQQLLEDSQKRDMERQAHQLRDSIVWLQLLDQDQDQESLFSRKADYREDDTCEWLLKNTDFSNWLDLDHGQKYLWLKGKPGSGKTTIATFILEKVKFPPDSLVLSCLCSQAFDLPASEFCTIVFRTFIGQILRKNPGFVPHVYEDFVKKAEVSTLRVLAPLLRTLLTSLPSAFIVLDGLDECNQEAQSLFIKKLDFVISAQKDSNSVSTPDVKILISSRDVKTIPNRLRRGLVVSLTKEAEHVSKDIGLYTTRKISELKDRFSSEQVKDIVEKIVAKANGMFLWVRLVTNELLEQHSLQDLHDTILRFPSDLKGLYQMILDRIEHRSNDRQRVYICTILTCMVYTHRSLKSWELCAAIVFSTPGQQLNERTKLEKGILDLCKPLLEEHANDTIAFVHFSVQEFLLKGKNIRFVDPSAGPQILAAICIRFLLGCDQFFSRCQSVSACRRIVLGHYVLFPYVHDYWRNHLVDETADNRMKQTEFQLLHVPNDDCLPYKNIPLRPLLDTQQLLVSEVSEIKERYWGEVSTKYAYAGIITAIASAMETQQSYEDHEAVISRHKDPITQAYESYREQFEALLQRNSCFTLEEMGVSEQAMTAFVDQYAQGAFLCSWPECSRKSAGFRCSGERDKHYQSHLSKLCCPESTCDFSTFNFPNRTALRRHLTRYHDATTEVPVPKFTLSKTVDRTSTTNSRQVRTPDTDNAESAARNAYPTAAHPVSYDETITYLTPNSPSANTQIRDLYPDFSSSSVRAAYEKLMLLEAKKVAPNDPELLKHKQFLVNAQQLAELEQSNKRRLQLARQQQRMETQIDGVSMNDVKQTENQVDDLDVDSNSIMNTDVTPSTASKAQSNYSSRPGFSSEQLILLRNQIQAFKILSKKMPLPTDIREKVFPRVAMEYYFNELSKLERARK